MDLRAIVTDRNQSPEESLLPGENGSHIEIGFDAVPTDIERLVKANRTISTGKLYPLLGLHLRPINQVVFLGPSGKAHLEEDFPLRCFQRLFRPHVATRQCRWRDNRNTRGASIPVLSY